MKFFVFMRMLGRLILKSVVGFLFFKKKFICFSFVLLVYGLSEANSQELPSIVHENLSYGELANGITYYVYPTGVVKNHASYYLIQHVGSLQEKKKQKGLAHFLEHMAFNGTTHFPEKELLTYFESKGLTFGVNINAYTSFDETVYNLTNIPCSNEDIVDKSLLTLFDWSSKITLDNEEIDAERGVIKEEWRTRNTSDNRVYLAALPTLYNNSKHSRRIPIGDMDIIENFDYKELKDFYKKWYKPHLQSIVVVGDINVDSIVAKIKKQFSKIPEEENKIKKENYNIPYHKGIKFVSVTDKETYAPAISVISKHKDKIYANNEEHISEEIKRNLLINLLNSRLSNLKENIDVPYNTAYVYFSRLSAGTHQFGIQIKPKTNKQKEALSLVLKECIRAKQHGFTASEINRAKIQIKADYKLEAVKEPEISHDKIQVKIQNFDLYKTPFCSAKQKLLVLEKVLDGFGSDNLKNYLGKLYAKDNKVVTVIGVKGENNIAKKEALNIIKNVESTEWKPLTDNFDVKNLTDGLEIKRGKIVTETYNKEIDAYTFELENGWKVHFKQADKNKGEIYLKGESPGGSSLYKNKDLPSLSFATSVAQSSGLYKYSDVELKKVVTGKRANVAVGITEGSEMFSGFGLVDDIDTLFELLYLRIMHPRFDESIFKIKKAKLREGLNNRYNNINNIKRDSITKALYSLPNPRLQIIDNEYIESISFKRAKEIYKERFTALNNLNLYIVADIEVKKIKELLQKYVAGLPKSTQNEVWINKTVPWKKNKVNKSIVVPMKTPMATVKFKFKNDLKKATVKNELLAGLVADILETNYTKVLREEMGATYGVSVSNYILKKPEEKIELSIGFNCEPNKTDVMVKATLNEINKLKEGRINATVLKNIIEGYLKRRKEQKNYNHFYFSQLYTYTTEGYNIDAVENYEEILSNIKKEDVQQFMNNFMDNNMQSYQIIFLPKTLE